MGIIRLKCSLYISIQFYQRSIQCISITINEKEEKIYKKKKKDKEGR